jgi:hypothetical protein
MSRLHRIGYHAFSHSLLLTFFIPPRLVFVDASAFKLAPLADFSVSPDNPNFCICDGFFFSSDLSTLVRLLEPAERITIPASVTTIGPYCFSHFLEIFDVDFAADSSVSVFGRRAFASTHIVSILIPKTVTIIGDSCFSKCYALAEVAFEQPSRVSRIGSLAFYCCEVETFCLPSSVQELESQSDEESRGSFESFRVGEFTVDPENEHFHMEGVFLIRTSDGSDVAFFGREFCI